MVTKSILSVFNTGVLALGVVTCVNAVTLTPIPCTNPELIDCVNINTGGGVWGYETGSVLLTDEIPTDAGLSGFVGDIRIDTRAGTGTEFGSWGFASPNYTGSRAVFNNIDGGNIRFSADARYRSFLPPLPPPLDRDNTYGWSEERSSSFDFVSIDISELANKTTITSTDVTFTASTVTGQIKTAILSLDGVFGMETFNFGDTFLQISTISWDQTPEWHQFDNIVVENVQASFGVQLRTVPIPSAVWLFGSGLLGLIGVVRRKKT